MTDSDDAAQGQMVKEYVGNAKKFYDLNKLRIKNFQGRFTSLFFKFFLFTLQEFRLVFQSFFGFYKMFTVNF